MRIKTNITTIVFMSLLALGSVFCVSGSKLRAATCPANPATGFLGGECPGSGAAPADPSAIAAINAQIADKQKQIDDLKQQAATYQQQVASAQGEVHTLESQVAAISNQITLTNLDIQTKQSELESLDLEIRSLQLSIDQKNADIETRRSALADTIRQLDSSTRVTPLTLVMEYNNFNEFFAQAQAQAQVSSGLESAIGQIQQAKNEIQNKQDELNKVKDGLKVAKMQLEDQKTAVQEEQSFKNDLLGQSKKSAAQYAQLLDQSQSEVDQVNSVISQLQNSLQSKLNGGSDTIDLPSPSGFIWPVPGRTINAYFLDPSYHLGGRRHYGIDIDADQGTPVKATADGIVRAATASLVIGGAPSVVQIQHGGGFVTYYLHMHQIYVAVGQEVKQGQLIGLSGGQCGTSGAGTCGVYTTGAHLHYEMHLDNLAVDPMKYLP